MGVDKMQGIYKITNVKNEKVYIGKSIDIQRRWIQHRSSLNRNVHRSGHLQNAWNKYGEDNFIFEILCETNSELETNEQEIYYIGLYNSTDENYGYNLRSGGEGGTLNDETKQKISISHRGLGSDLSEDVVRQIKMAIYCLMDRKEISEKFKVSQKIITSIAIGQSFNYVCEELNDKIHNIKQKLIDNRNNEFLFMYDNGMTITEITNKTGFSASIVEKCIYKYREPNNDKKYKQLEKYNQIIELHKQGVIDYKISKIVGVSPSTVGRYLRGENHPLNKPGNIKITDEVSKIIYDMYFVNKLSSIKISQELGITKTTVMTEINKYKNFKSSNQHNKVAFSMQNNK